MSTVNAASSNTNTILDRLGHDAHVLGQDERAQTSALIPNARSVQEHRELHLGSDAAEIALDLALEGLPEATEAAAGGAAAVLAPALFAYKALKGFHEDWLKGENIKGAAFNDAASFAVAGVLDFPAGFKTEDHHRRPGVERAGMKMAEELKRHPDDVKALQKSADRGFVDAEKAWQAVKDLPSEQRLPGLLKQLTMAGKGDDLQSDLAYGKGVEAFLYVQQHPETAASETDKVHARAGRPPQTPFHVRG